MIESLSVSADARIPVSWWRKAFAASQVWEFRSGINIIWGPNGSGKSTILTLLARLLCCEHTGYSKVTKSGYQDLFDQTPADQEGSHLPSGVEVQHDGQEVRYFSPEKVTGGQFGLAAFDFEVDDPWSAYMLKASYGQINVHRLGAVIKPQVRKRIEWVRPPQKNYVPNPECRDHRREQDMWLQNFLNGNQKKGPPTVLLDEPDAGMDWPTKQTLWDLLWASSASKQYIIASHSLFAMTQPDAHYLELKPDYLDECCKVVRGTGVWQTTLDGEK